MLRAIYLLSVAIIICVPMFFIVTPLNIVRIWFRDGKEAVTTYLKNVAIGFDQLGGAYLYNQPDYTVSTMTHVLSESGEPAAKVFRVIIDFLFGKNHCRESYEWELSEHDAAAKAMRERV